MDDAEESTTIRAGLARILLEYEDSAKAKYGKEGSPLLSFLMDELPKLIQSAAYLSEDYVVEGSGGKGQWTFTPWLAVMDKAVTTSTQKGYYIAFLFDYPKQVFYLSFGIGYTQYEKKYKHLYGLEGAREQLRKQALLLRGKLEAIPSQLSLNQIQFSIKTNLSSGYSAGHITGKMYELDSMPKDRQLISDLRDLLGVYNELKGKVGNGVMEYSGETEEEFFEDVNAVDPSTLTNIEPEIVPLKVTSTVTKSRRDKYTAASVLEKYKYVCGFDSTHETFTHKSGHQYMEPHHLIPLGMQKEFEFSLDVAENIVPLCPNCHRKIHSAIDQEREEMIVRLHTLLLEGITKRGIYINLAELQSFYA